MAEKKDALVKIVGSENVFDDTATRDEDSRDRIRLEHERRIICVPPASKCLRRTSTSNRPGKIQSDRLLKIHQLVC